MSIIIPEDGGSMFFLNASIFLKITMCHNPEDHDQNILSSRIWEKYLKKSL
jgi:hypothetical protein